MDERRTVDLSGGTWPSRHSAENGWKREGRMFRVRITRVLALISIGALLAACGSTPRSATHHGHHRSATARSTTTPSGTAASSTSSAPPSPRSGGAATAQTPQITGPHAVVNGCDPTMIDPAGPFGMCLDGLPLFYCCSSAATGWSGIVAGMDVDIKGAVPIDPKTRAPQSSAVLLLGPNGWRTTIPVAASGAFNEEVAFPTAGSYQIGVQYLGTPADLETFLVAWRWDVLRGTTVATVFPSETIHFPQSDVLLLEAIGHPAPYTIKLENAQGVPQSGGNLAIGPWQPLGHPPSARGWVADSQGVVTFTAPATDMINSIGQIEPGLLLMSYADIRPQGDTLVGFPSWQGPTGLPTDAPFSIEQGGVRYYDVEDFFARAEGGDSFGGPGMAPAYDYNPSSEVVSLSNPMSRHQARIVLASGAVQGLTVSGGNTPTTPVTTTWTTAGTVKPVMQGAQAYLTMQDLVTVAGAFAWAASDGSGGMYFTYPWAP